MPFVFLFPVILGSCTLLGAQADEIRLVRSLSGPSGTVVDNRFVFDETRTRFVYPQDKALVVYFEWDAPPGAHALSGILKGPDGRAVSLSQDIKLQTRTRELHAYWMFELSPSMTSGIWTLEVRADGRPAGSHVFEVTVPEALSVNPAQVALTPPSLDEIYKAALRSLVWVHRLDASGRRTNTGSGFVIGKDRVATAFQNIDAASSLEVEFADGRVVRTNNIWDANRIQDWATIRADTLDVPALKHDQSQGISVGERLIALNVENDRTRTIGGVDITGRQDLQGFPARTQLSPELSPKAIGGPLLTTFGKVAGIIGASLTPGARFEERTTGLTPTLSTRLAVVGAATPMKLVPETAPASATSLKVLADSGVLSTPLVPHPSFSYGGLTTSVPRDANAPEPRTAAEFSRQDSLVWVYTWWQKRDKVGKGTLSAKIYDAQNRLRVRISPIKASLLENAPTRFSFSFPPTKLERGIYRIDVIWQDQAVWRSFFTILD